MKLSQSFTTATTFSKFFALFLFILFPLVGFKLGMEYQKMASPHQQTQVPSPITETQQLSCEQQGGTWLSQYNECEGINQEQCTRAMGTFNECASNCRHDPDYPNVYCIQVCVPICKF